MVEKSKSEIDLGLVYKEVVIQEWKLTEDAIRGYDTIFMGIRGFATTSIGGLTLYSITKIELYGIIIAAISIPLFWLSELLMRRIQSIFIERAREIEKHISSGAFYSTIERGVFNRAFPGIGKKFSYYEKNQKKWFSKAIKDSTGYVVYIALLAMVATGAIIIKCHNEPLNYDLKYKIESKL